MDVHAHREASPGVHPLRAASVDAVARVVLEGFDRHFRLFRAATARIEAGEVVDFFPYPQSIRFRSVTAR